MEIKLEILPVLSWGIHLQRPLIIAGPCSAETEDQVMATALELASCHVHIFRAGLWKPRTRPDHFEGVGSKGLPWLQRVKKETGMLTATEVASAMHVDEAIKYGVDILWLGARTTTNPFTVQEIADALRGVHIPVLVKNPVNPDIELWLGALERLNKAGISKIGAIHRGFSSYDTSHFRNPPQWQIPIELKRRVPDVPVIIDPSHMGGKKSLLYELTQKSLDLHYDGLMIEVHNTPEQALSDTQQQITPSEFRQLLKRLIIRMPETDNKIFINTLEELRREIDKLDDEVINILEHRMKIAETIGKYKKENNVTILQSKRWNEMIRKRVELGKRKGLSEEFMYRLLKAIHQESINHQENIMNHSMMNQPEVIKKKQKIYCCYLLTGGNSGNRLFYLSEACRMIENETGKILKHSSVYETEPWGFRDKQFFLNQVIQIYTELSPGELLLKITEIEYALGRERTHDGYSSRTIDIDILFYDDLIINEAGLAIPHPLFHLRKFAMIPMAEINNLFIHPVFHKTVGQLLTECNDNLIVRKYTEPH